MKKLHFTYEKNRNKYEVPLEFGNKYTFKSKKEVVRFIQSIKKLFNSYYQSALNFISKLYRIYYKNFQFYDNKTARTLSSIQDQLNDLIDLSVKKFTIENNNYFVISNLKSIYVLIGTALHTLISFSSRYKHLILKKEIEVLQFNFRKVEENLIIDLRHVNRIRTGQTKVINILKELNYA